MAWIRVNEPDNYNEIHQKATNELLSAAHNLRNGILTEQETTFYPGRSYLEEADALLEFVIKNLVRAHNECVK